jgi:hypothetical protein
LNQQKQGARTRPWGDPISTGKPPTFAIISIISKRSFWSHKNNFSVETKHTRVVASALVHDREADVQQKIVAVANVKQLEKAFPRVSDSVHLEEVIFAAIATKFQFRAKPVARALPPAFSDGFVDALEVSRKVKSPLIQATS